MREFVEDVAMMLKLILFVIMVAGILILAISPVYKMFCLKKTEDIGLNSRWGFWRGCQVEVEEGRWIPYERWLYGEIGR